MILTLWTIFLILSITLLVLGYTFYNTQVSDILIVVGWVFMFALGVILLSNAVEYKTGSSQTTIFTYSEYDYSVDGTNFTDIIVNSSTITETNVYTAFSEEGTGALNRVANSHLWGFLLMIAGLFGAILFWFDVKAYDNEKDKEYEEY